MPLINEIRDLFFLRNLLIILYGCFSTNSYAMDSMEGPSVVPKISGIVGRISACTSGVGGSSTWIMIENRDDKQSLQIKRTTREYSPRLKSWQTYEFIPLNKITIVDSLKENKYEMTFSSALFNFKYKFTKDLKENSWSASLRLEKKYFFDCAEKVFWCNEISPQLQSWSEDRIKKIKMDGN